SKIGRITTSGSVTEYPSATGPPYWITAGPDGALWFTSNGFDIGRITTSGSTTAFPTPTSSGYPTEITAGPDGALWFTEVSGNNIGRITTPGPGPPASLALAPKTATGTVGTQHCVVATVDDAANSSTPNINIVFSVSGSVNTSGAQTTDAN